MCFETPELTKNEALALAQWFGDGINKYFDEEFDLNRADGEQSTRGFNFVFFNLRNDEIETIQNWLNSHCKR